MRSKVVAFLKHLGLTAFASPHPRSNYQVYPNIPGEVLLENEFVVVQRFIIEPGQWEGVHSHPGNQLYIYVKGGEWTSRQSGVEEVGIAENGSVGWTDAVDISEQHESGNTGDTTHDLIWVTLKTDNEK